MLSTLSFWLWRPNLDQPVTASATWARTLSAKASRHTDELPSLPNTDGSLFATLTNTKARKGNKVDVKPAATLKSTFTPPASTDTSSPVTQPTSAPSDKLTKLQLIKETKQLEVKKTGIAAGAYQASGKSSCPNASHRSDRREIAQRFKSAAENPTPSAMTTYLCSRWAQTV